MNIRQQTFSNLDVSVWLITIFTFLSVFLISFTSYLPNSVNAINTGGGTTPCNPLLCGTPFPQSIIKTFTPIIDLNNQGFVESFDVSASGNSQ